MLEEVSEEDAEEADAKDNEKNTSAESHGGLEQMPSISMLSNSLKNAQIGEKSWEHDAKVQNNGYVTSASSSNQSKNEQLLASSSFMKFADMSKEQWNQFLREAANITSRSKGKAGDILMNTAECFHREHQACR
ncbi:hypothetical protein MLD38_000234 [Melastoma candidum]|uniref:Uncharacterized protein n=1 Tax=Melastoma candidum TaxID=119954 RepID=A0ACB9S915_9MYRT|nr:hypothetical protein MLD38_000234 [Melastoma candidum]